MIITADNQQDLDAVLTHFCSVSDRLALASASVHYVTALSPCAAGFRSPVLHLHVGNHWDAEGRYCGSQQVGGSPAAYKHGQDLQLLALLIPADLKRQIRESLLLRLTSWCLLL